MNQAIGQRIKMDVADTKKPLHAQLGVSASDTIEFEADRRAIERLVARKVLSANDARAGFNRLYHLLVDRFGNYENGDRGKIGEAS